MAVETKSDQRVTYHAYTLAGRWLYRETCPLYQFVKLVDGAMFSKTTKFEVMELFKLPRHHAGSDWGTRLSYWLRRGDRALAHWPSGGYSNRGWHPHPVSVISICKDRSFGTVLDGRWNRQTGLETVFKIAEFFQVSVGSVIAAITHEHFKKVTLVFEGEAKDDKAN